MPDGPFRIFFKHAPGVKEGPYPYQEQVAGARAQMSRAPLKHHGAGGGLHGSAVSKNTGETPVPHFGAQLSAAPFRSTAVRACVLIK